MKDDPEIEAFHDRALTTSRRMGAVEWMLAHGGKWIDDRWVMPASLDMAAAAEDDSEPGVKMKIVCPDCGSDDVVRDACSRWDVGKQDWVMTTVYDNMTCDACEYESSSFNEEPVAEDAPE